MIAGQLACLLSMLSAMCMYTAWCSKMAVWKAEDHGIAFHSSTHTSQTTYMQAVTKHSKGAELELYVLTAVVYSYCLCWCIYVIADSAMYLLTISSPENFPWF